MIGSLGDTLVTIPALKAVRNHFGGDARIDVLHNSPVSTEVSSAEVLRACNLTNFFLSYCSHNAYSILRLWLKLVRNKYHGVVYLAPSDRTLLQVWRDRFFFFLCGIRQQIGFHRASDFLFNPDKSKKNLPVKHEALCRLERLKQAGFKFDVRELVAPPILVLSQAERQEALNYLSTRRKHPGRHLLAVCPGSRQPANFWGNEKFEELWKGLCTHPGIELLFLGGQHEREFGDHLIETYHEGLNVAGEMAILKSAAFLSLCLLAVCVNSGPGHLAAAVGTRVVGIYGRRDLLGRWEPMGERHSITYSDVPCAGCGLSVCNVTGHPCMSNIQVIDIMNKVENIIAQELL